MRFGLKLKIALLPVLAVVFFKGAFDIDRMSFVALDEVAVIAIHRANEVRERSPHGLRQTAPEPRGLGGKLDRQVHQHCAMPRVRSDRHRFHQPCRLAPVFRLDVRVDVRLIRPHVLMITGNYADL
jgi:hypothetical protein